MNHFSYLGGFFLLFEPNVLQPWHQTIWISCPPGNWSPSNSNDTEPKKSAARMRQEQAIASGTEASPELTAKCWSDILGTGLLTIWILHDIVLSHSRYLNSPTKHMPFCWIKMVELFPYSSQHELSQVEQKLMPCRPGWHLLRWVLSHVEINFFAPKTCMNLHPKDVFVPSFCGEIFCDTFCNIQNLWNDLPIF